MSRADQIHRERKRMCYNSYDCMAPPRSLHSLQRETGWHICPPACHCASRGRPLCFQPGSLPRDMRCPAARDRLAYISACLSLSTSGTSFVVSARVAAERHAESCRDDRGQLRGSAAPGIRTGVKIRGMAAEAATAAGRGPLATTRWIPRASTTPTANGRCSSSKVAGSTYSESHLFII